MTPEKQEAFDHAWRYFALHAEQRMSLFNHFIALSGLLATGLAYSIQGSTTLHSLGIAAGLLLAALAFLFWRLDQRVAGLVKLGENGMATIEQENFPSNLQVFHMEAALSKNQHFFSSGVPWTYGRSFRHLFLVMAILGIAGSAVSVQQVLSSSRSPRALQPKKEGSAEPATRTKARAGERTLPSKRLTISGAKSRDRKISDTEAETARELPDREADQK